eukprot:2968122-Pyramimonas_sp.AAC.1
MPSDKDIIHDAPPGLSELVDKTWNQPFDRAPTHGRWGVDSVNCTKSKIIVRVCGNQCSFPGCEVQRDPNNATAALEVMHDT